MKKSFIFGSLICSSIFAISANAEESLDYELLKGMYQCNWDNYDDETRRLFLESFAMNCSDILGIEKPQITYFYEDSLNEANYDWGTNVISINENIMFSSVSSLKALAHELRHAWQWGNASCPEDDFDYMLLRNFNNYISSDNYNSYSSQYIEVDANNFANWVYNEYISTAGYSESLPLSYFVEVY